MADAAPSEPLSWRHPMFAVLADAEIVHTRRFGTLHVHSGGTRLIIAGEPGPGVFEVLSGSVESTRRPGSRHAHRAAPSRPLDGRGGFAVGQALVSRRGRDRTRRGSAACRLDGCARSSLPKPISVSTRRER